MTEDVTLDVFTDGATPTDADGDDVDATDEPNPAASDADTATSGGAVEGLDSAPVPPWPTSTWRQDDECESCGARVGRRFQATGGSVCIDCVSWTPGPENGDDPTG